MRETQVITSKFTRCKINAPVLQRAIIVKSNLNPKKLVNADTEGLIVL